MYSRRNPSLLANLLTLVFTAVCSSLFVRVQAQIPPLPPQTQPWILFASERGGGQEDIYLMDENGQNIRRLTDHISSDESPSWASDGLRIAFVSARDLEEEIYILELNTGRLTRLVHPGPDATPSWSPDEREIAFTSNFNLKWEIYAVDVKSSKIRQLTFQREGSGVSDVSPAWSPDGHKIAFNSNRDGTRDIYVMDADGLNVKRLTKSQRPAYARKPAWSPDGRKIAFDAFGWDGQREGDIYIMNPDGTELKRVTDHPAPDVWPTWLDDHRIVFESSRDGHSDIYMTDLEGKTVVRLTDHPRRDAQPAAWADPALTRSVSPLGKGLFTWGWIKEMWRR